jgi:arylsulfatase A-like enzyme
MNKIILILLTLYSGFAQEKKPNIIILFADDLGYEELGCQGNKDIPTPYIDSIAKNGVRFTDGYVTAPVCAPSRAGLMSGRHQSRFGWDINVMPHTIPHSAFGIPETETTIAERMKEAGYRTGLIGKWHLGSRSDFNPTRHGFDYFFGFAHEGRYFVRPPYNGVTTLLRKDPLPEGGENNRWFSKDGKLIYHDILRNEPLYDQHNPILRGKEIIEEKRYLTDAFTDEAIKFIDREKEKPFFLFLAYNAVHSPLQGADAYMDKMSHIKDIHRRIFAAMLANLDDSVGAVLGKLRKEKLEENTLIFFLSDNGGPTKELTSSNLPLKGGKGMFFEGGIRIPFLAQWKGIIPAGQVYENPIISLDMYATAATLGDLKLTKKDTDGVNLIPFLKGEEKGIPHDQLFWDFTNKAAFREGDWKIVKHGKWHLYNLKEDISEENDLSKKNPDKFKDLLAKWTTIRKTMPPLVPKKKKIKKKK